MNASTGEQQQILRLNEQIAVMEQQRDTHAKTWFRNTLSDNLVFRRVSGAVVDKQAFLKSLDETNPFTSRKADEMSVTVLGERALVTLIVRTTKADGTEQRFRNIRLFSKLAQGWILELWYNYELTSL